MKKMQGNLAENYRVVLITSSDKYAASCQLADVAGILNRVDVYPAETFVAQNMDELAMFNRASFLKTFRRLLLTYNTRVDAIEPEKSLLIEIPGRLEA